MKFVSVLLQLFLVADYISHYAYHEKMCSVLLEQRNFIFFLELNKARARVEKWNVDHSKSDRITRELRAQVDDLTEAVAAKDSQLAVLKVRLQEADQMLNSRTEALEALQSEKSRQVVLLIKKRQARVYMFGNSVVFTAYEESAFLEI